MRWYINQDMQSPCEDEGFRPTAVDQTHQKSHTEQYRENYGVEFAGTANKATWVAINDLPAYQALGEVGYH